MVVVNGIARRHLRRTLHKSVCSRLDGALEPRPELLRLLRVVHLVPTLADARPRDEELRCAVSDPTTRSQQDTRARTSPLYLAASGIVPAHSCVSAPYGAGYTILSCQREEKG